MTTQHHNESLARALRAVESSEPLNAPFLAAISHAQVRALEYHAMSESITRQRRLVELALAYDSSTLTAMRVENPQLYRQMIDASMNFREHVRMLDALNKSAIARLALTGIKLCAQGGRS